MSETSSRLPWWGLLVHADSEVAGPAIDVALKRHSYDRTSVEMTKSVGWTGVFFFKKEDIETEIADELRVRFGEVIGLDFGDPSLVYRWHGTWNVEDVDERPRVVAASVGIVVPSPESRPERPTRMAALLEGIAFEDLSGEVSEPKNVARSHRGAILLGELWVGYRLCEERNLRMVEVLHYLDDDTFKCTIYKGDDAWVFPPDAVSPSWGLPTVDSIEGETEPRAIVRKLGIPEDFIFPAS
jgi:hypothetical protein